MMRRVSLLLLLAGISGCASTFYSATKGASMKSPDDTFTCIQDQLGKLGYKRKNYDSGERWYVGQKTDPSAHLADVRFRQRVDRLDTRVRPDANGNSSVEIKAQSFNQFDNQQGLSEEEVSASSQVKQDAQAIMGACKQ